MAEWLRESIESALDGAYLDSSKSAVNLLMMIAAHESGGFSYVKQVGGPALGLFQMEPASFFDTVRYMRERKDRFSNILSNELVPEYMAFYGPLAAAMARVYLMRFPEPIPAHDDIDGLARYAKKYWNTEKGKARWTDYRDAYLKYVA